MQKRDCPTIDYFDVREKASRLRAETLRKGIDWLFHSVAVYFRK